MDTSCSVSSFSHTERTLVILPIGSCEQHGPFLPLDTDLRIAQLLAENVAQSFPDQDALILSPLPFSCSWEHRGVGTISLQVSTLAAVIHDIAKSLAVWQSPCLLILLNWHGGNDLLGALATEITATEGIPSAAIPSTSQVGKAWDKSAMTTATDVHAGAIETAILQAYWPDLLQDPIPADAHDDPDILPAKVQSVLQSIGSGITKQGIWGAPEQADVEKGRALIETLVADMHLQITKLRELVKVQYPKERE